MLKHIQKIAGVLMMVPVIAHSGVTITSMLGLNYQELANDKQEVALDRTAKQGERVENDYSEAYSLGYEFTPWLALEGEYLQTQAEATEFNGGNTTHDARIQQYNLNMILLSDAWTKNYASKWKPYVLLGGGRSELETKAFTNRLDIHESADSIVNLGAGTYYRFNRWLSARGELRAVRNVDHDWWEAQALAGIQLAIPRYVTPEPIVVVPVTLPAPVVVVKKQPPPAPPLDSDGDGVPDINDDCPDTPRNYRVDERGCPRMLTEAVELQVKVLFDTDKWEIKPQYKPEVEKLAEFLKDYPTANATIEGHTDSSGGNKWNIELSANRANAVRIMLIQEYGIDERRLSSAGFASSRPVADNSTPAGRAQNRRTVAVVSGEKKSVVTK